MIVEINGVKMEIDEREAKTIETYRVGSVVKVLQKSYSEWKVSWGVIVGFCDFKSHPSIEVLVCKAEYGSPEINILTINDASEDIEIAPANEYEPKFKAEDVIAKMEAKIQEYQGNIYTVERKLAAFKKYFGHIIEETSDETI